MRVSIPLFVSVLVLCPAASARAADTDAKKLALLPVIIAGGESTNAASVFGAVNAAAALRPRVSVMTLDEYYSLDGIELAEGALACGQDTACIAQKLTPFSAELGLVVIINNELVPPLLSLILIEVGAQRIAAEHYGQVQGGSAKLTHEIELVTSKFFDDLAFRRAGRIVVSVDPPQAKIMVPGGLNPDRGTPNIYTLQPGSYEIAAMLDGYERATAGALVKSGETTSINIQLAKESSIIESPWFWVGTAAVVVGTAVAIGAVALRNTRDCICVITAGETSCSVCQ